jgi:hypothetical protein
MTGLRTEPPSFVAAPAYRRRDCRNCGRSARESQRHCALGPRSPVASPLSVNVIFIAGLCPPLNACYSRYMDALARDVDVRLGAAVTTEGVNAAEELAEFEFTPLTPLEEIDIADQILLVGAHPCR